MSITFTVLTPTGRRQSVKVTPNSTVLQILEEACTKQKLDAAQYDLRHHSRILDTSSVVRFAQLPNNAMLEMVLAKKKREESPVNIMLQLEDGARLNGDFLPNCNLKEVIVKLCPPELSSVENPVIIYMRKEISGFDDLSKTTLKELGLTSGRALLRFLNRTKDQLGQQLNVSNPLTKPVPKPIITEPAVRNDSVSAMSVETEPNIPCPPVEPLKESEVPIESMECESACNASEPLESNLVDFNDDLKTAENRQALKRVLGEEIKNGSSKMDCSSNAYDSVPFEKKPCKSYEVQEPKIDVSKIEFLGEREALIFHLSDHKGAKLREDSLPEEFFDLTLEDAKSLMRDYRRVREEMENAVLSTQAMKDLSESRRVINNLNKYQQTVVRIQFPDRFVLQGVFRPLETVQQVIDFIKIYLKNPDSPFYVYTVPPKTVLEPSQTLVEADCVPAAVVYFGSVEDSSSFLKEKFVFKAVEPSIAAYFANKSRKYRSNSTLMSISDDKFSNQNESEMECIAGPSNENPSAKTNIKTVDYSNQKPRSQKPDGAVPKWFKPV